MGSCGFAIPRWLSNFPVESVRENSVVVYPTPRRHRRIREFSEVFSWAIGDQLRQLETSELFGSVFGVISCSNNKGGIKVSEIIP